MVDELAPWVALGLAVTLVPVYAVSTGDVPRDVGADVVSQTDAYLAALGLAPVLNSSNNYETDAITLTHQYVDNTELRFHVNNTGSESRFVFVNDTGTLSAGASDTVQIEDTDLLHPTGTYSVDTSVETTVRQDGETVGSQRTETTISVTVE